MDRDALARLARTALPILAVLSFGAGVGLTLAVAGDTLGYDFLAYHAAIERVADGGPLYDMSYTETGGFGLFYYPPTFAPLLLPFALLAAKTATLAWIGLSRSLARRDEPRDGVGLRRGRRERHDAVDRRVAGHDDHRFARALDRGRIAPYLEAHRAL